MGIIYKVINDINQKIYIGQTVNSLAYRWGQHIKASYSQESKQLSHFHLAIRKYGSDHFYPSIIEQCEDKELDEKEKYWINFYNSFELGYNSTTGGQKGSTRINELTLEKFYSSWKEGKSLSEISELTSHDRHLIKEKLKNCFNISEEEFSLRGISVSKNKKIKPIYIFNLFGKCVRVTNSEELSNEYNLTQRTIQRKCREKGVIKNNILSYDSDEQVIKNYINTLPKIQQKTLKGEIINLFINISEAQRQTGINNIGKACRGEIRTAGGYIWEKIDG